MEVNRRANAVFFGLDFQVNAAIVLMIENIKDLRSLRLESEAEDIDIELCNGNHVLAQAKAVVNSSSDFSNVRRNLKKALASLNDGCKKVKTEKLIFVTNSPNPLNDDGSKSVFYGDARRDFETLPESAKKIITDYLCDIAPAFETNKLCVSVIPFETDDDHERYKVVMGWINKFVGELQLNIPGIGEQLHRVWNEEVFRNGTKKSTIITLSKKQLIWPVIVIATDINRINQGYLDELDDAQYDEIVRRYKDTICSCCEKLEFFTKILFDYNEYSFEGKTRDKVKSFVEKNYSTYSTEFEKSGMDSDIAEALAKVILFNVIQRRYEIDRIKKGVALDDH